jgi:hypothetical protein
MNHKKLKKKKNATLYKCGSCKIFFGCIIALPPADVELVVAATDDPLHGYIKPSAKVWKVDTN